jgi:hypothetical protein
MTNEAPGPPTKREWTGQCSADRLVAAMAIAEVSVRVPLARSVMARLA